MATRRQIRWRRIFAKMFAGNKGKKHRLRKRKRYGRHTTKSSRAFTRSFYRKKSRMSRMRFPRMSNERTAQEIKNIDDRIWNKYNIHSRTEMERRGLVGKYNSQLRSEVRRRKLRYNKGVFKELEFDNFHSANEALGRR